MENTLKIWTDGSCNYRDRLGGWAYIIEDQFGNIQSNRGGLRKTTNQRAEMTAAIQALSSVPDNTELILISDSEYLLKGISIWMEKWSRTGWKVKNPDLWKKIYDIIDDKNLWVHCRWVKGHSNNEYNNECDRLASLARKEARRRSING